MSPREASRPRGRGSRVPAPVPGEGLQAEEQQCQARGPSGPLASLSAPPSLPEWTQASRQSRRVPEGWWQAGACDPHVHKVAADCHPKGWSRPSWGPPRCPRSPCSRRVLGSSPPSGVVLLPQLPVCQARPTLARPDSSRRQPRATERLRLQFWGAMSCSSRWLIQEPEGRRRDQGGGNCEATAAWTRESTAGSEIGPAVEGSAERSSPSTGGGVCGTPRVKGDSECLGLSGWKVTTH